MKKRNPFYKQFLAAKLSSCASHAKHYRRCLFSFAVIGIFHSGYSGLLCNTGELMPSAAMKFTFEQYEFATGSALYQTILTGFLLNGAAADIAAASINTDGERSLQIYVYGDGGWAQKLDTTLRSEVMYVDVANIGGRDRLITYEKGRLNWFDPESTSEHPLVQVSSVTPSLEGAIPHVDVTRDLNGDGRDDLVVPDSDGFWVFIQMESNTFADPVKIGSPIDADRIFAADGYRYDPWEAGSVHEMDYNQDGRNDLVYWNENHFLVHQQDERGLFSSTTESFTTDIAFDSDDIASLAAPEGVRGRRFDHGAPGSMTGRVLHALTDMNHDGVSDLTIFSLHAGTGRLLGQTSQMWGMHSSYEVHFGVPADSGTTFEKEVSTAIRSDGIPFEVSAGDLDNDGQVDLMFAIINPGIFKIIGMLVRGFLTDSTFLDLNLYRMENGLYPDTPVTTLKIKAHTPGDSGAQALHFPSLLFGDVNGDGRPDLLVQNGQNELQAFFGVQGSNMFAQKPQKITVNMPFEEYTRLVDFNMDGVQDLLMHHPSTTEPHRVTILIAR